MLKLATILRQIAQPLGVLINVDMHVLGSRISFVVVVFGPKKCTVWSRSNACRLIYRNVLLKTSLFIGVYRSNISPEASKPYVLHHVEAQKLPKLMTFFTIWDLRAIGRDASLAKP